MGIGEKLGSFQLKAGTLRQFPRTPECVLSRTAFFSAEPLQKGLRVSVEYTECAAFSSSLNDSMRFCLLGQELQGCHKLSNSECDLIALKLICS